MAHHHHIHAITRSNMFAVFILFLSTMAASAQELRESPSHTTSFESKETFTVKSVSFTMIRVDGGTFMMGATKEQGNDADDDDERPIHPVTLSTYMIGETEVTQALWQAVMGSNPSHFKGDMNKPVEYVSWIDCQEFVKRLNAITGKEFRLPTEAEWEYAARGGSKSQGFKYSGSNKLKEVAWYKVNSYDKGQSSPDYGTHPVGKKSSNELGLYDMSGNVWEWCQDWYDKDYYGLSPQTDPVGPLSGSFHVIRGGCWRSYAKNGCVSLRFLSSPVRSGRDLGLRLAL